MLVIKTSRSRVEEMEKRLLELHPYDTPELVRIEPAHVDARYLEWLLASVR
jgi:periplasmic divalent cation tolerance protein